MKDKDLFAVVVCTVTYIFARVTLVFWSIVLWSIFLFVLNTITARLRDNDNLTIDISLVLGLLLHRPTRPVYFTYGLHQSIV